MSTPSPANKIEVASISDRGLSEKRPLNEDSFLADAERGIFVVADGVGGADAGEVASQTAVDVLNEAFRQKIAGGEDVEDLMELAIQRANSSIHQMAVDNPRFSMMATTVVALHLDGNRATIGHVGDSRLYRLSPDGRLLRETEDHSIVEEEVRAGRMTPEQAASHPSKNVMSRALGAEASVEADMKVIEVEDGSAFLLCTDGITRHLPDDELQDLLTSGHSPSDLCEEMKRRCYQRGAEDNLTAVIVQVGTPQFTSIAADDERTKSYERFEMPTPDMPNISAEPKTTLTPASRVAFPGPVTAESTSAPATLAAKKSGGSGVLRFFVFVLFLAVGAGAFYGGMRYQQQRAAQTATAQPSPSASDQQLTNASKRAAVDADPRKWMNDNMQPQLAKENISKPTDSKDSEFLYLYGRALMLNGSHHEALQAFELALTNVRANSMGTLPLETEIRLADAAAALKISRESTAPRSQEVSMAEDKAIGVLDETLGVKAQPSPK